MGRRNRYYCTQDTSNYSLNLFNAGDIKHGASNVDQFNPAGLDLPPHTGEPFGRITTRKRRVNKRSSLLNRKNKCFLGDCL